MTPARSGSLPQVVLLLLVLSQIALWPTLEWLRRPLADLPLSVSPAGSLEAETRIHVQQRHELSLDLPNKDTHGRQMNPVALAGRHYPRMDGALIPLEWTLTDIRERQRRTHPRADTLRPHPPLPDATAQGADSLRCETCARSTRTLHYRSVPFRVLAWPPIRRTPDWYPHAAPLPLEAAGNGTITGSWIGPAHRPDRRSRWGCLVLPLVEPRAFEIRFSARGWKAHACGA